MLQALVDILGRGDAADRDDGHGLRDDAAQQIQDLQGPSTQGLAGEPARTALGHLRGVAAQAQALAGDRGVHRDDPVQTDSLGQLGDLPDLLVLQIRAIFTSRGT
ncbi:hypothetical protein A5N15_06780 [Rothia kristinae]|uniref:Uncharacterized protein n=1 Tax=Rothia kristinae TaxID=37923 RepID=A0A657IUN2_9MICC|nr:hypothetical protein A5N15_06780 [Rothia kristinae]